ncbi:MAG TPA: hypothetical protein VIJ47_04195 [Acidimicrobiales bacterium]
MPDTALSPLSGHGSGVGPAAPSGLRRRWRSARATGLIWVLGAFIASRSLAAAAGMRFDATTLDSAWQFIDPELLRTHLTQSLYYSHTQPPLFNALLGLVLKLSPFPDGVSFQVVFLAMGLALTISVFALSRALGARRVTAVVVTIVATCSPATLLYENWLFYTYPEALLVTVIAVAVFRWVDTGRQAWLVAVGLSAMALVLTRSLFHPAWYLAVAALAWLGRRPARRRNGLVALGLPLLFVVAVVAKNQVLFDTPGLSSWLGMNLWRVSTEQLPPATRQRLIDDGTLSPQAALQAFQTYDVYQPLVPPCRRAHPDIPVLAQARKTSGWVNYNDECFLPIYRQAQRDAVAAARADPGSTLASQVASWHLSFLPASDYPYLTTNRSTITRYEDLYNGLALVQVGTPPVVRAPNNERDIYRSPIGISLTIVAAFAAVVASALASLRRWRVSPPPTAAIVTRVYVGLTVLMVFVVGNGLEIRENNRFRWVVEPLMLIVLAITIQQLVDRFRAARQAAG